MTPLQKKASEENWNLFQIKGMISKLRHMQYSLTIENSRALGGYLNIAIHNLMSIEETIKREQEVRKFNRSKETKSK